MKKRITVIFALCFAVIVMLCGSLSVCAESYIIKEDFASAADCLFLAPGDVDADGHVVANDLTLLKKLLLIKKSGSYADVYKQNGETAKYSDINGDGLVNVIDIVRQKKNLSKILLFVDGGVMTLNGNSAFKGDFTSALSANASYDICLTYKSDTPIKVKIGDLGKEIVFDASAKVTTVVKSFETPATVTDEEGIDFQIIGVASIEDISVVRVNMDNDIVDNW